MNSHAFSRKNRTARTRSSTAHSRSRADLSGCGRGLAPAAILCILCGSTLVSTPWNGKISAKEIVSYGSLSALQGLAFPPEDVECGPCAGSVPGNASECCAIPEPEFLPDGEHTDDELDPLMWCAGLLEMCDPNYPPNPWFDPDMLEFDPSQWCLGIDCGDMSASASGSSGGSRSGRSSGGAGTAPQAGSWGSITNAFPAGTGGGGTGSNEICTQAVGGNSSSSCAGGSPQGGCSPIKGNPFAVPPRRNRAVDLRTGHKHEQVADLVVPMRRGSFSFTRTYTSNRSLWADPDAGGFGPQWTSNHFSYLRFRTNVDESGFDHAEIVQGFKKVVFRGVHDNGTKAASFDPIGNSLITVSHMPSGSGIERDWTLTGTPSEIAVWAVEMPGQWTAYYADNGGDGSISPLVRYETHQGTRLDYHYILGAIAGPSDNKFLLTRILAQSRTPEDRLVVDNHWTPDAMIRLEWQLPGSPTAGMHARIAGLDVLRPERPDIDNETGLGSTNAWILTDQVRYAYADWTGEYGIENVSPDVAESGSAALIQVEYRTPLSSLAGDYLDRYTKYTDSTDPAYADVLDPTKTLDQNHPKVRRVFLQYRYHDEASAHGNTGQLKAIIMPGEIEYALRDPELGITEAWDLLELDDEDDAVASSNPTGSEIQMKHLFAKRLSHVVTGTAGEGIITEQELRNGCGCGSAGGTVLLSYEFQDNSTGEYSRSVQIVESHFDGSGWNDHITIWHDLRDPYALSSSMGAAANIPGMQREAMTAVKEGGPAFTADEVIEDRVWVTRMKHNAETGLVEEVAYSTVFSDYARDGSGTFGVPSHIINEDTTSTTTGRRAHLTYTAEGWLETISIGPAKPDVKSLLTKYTYTSNGRIAKLERVRESGHASIPTTGYADKVQVTEYDYAVHDGVVRAVRISQPAENSTDQNGPASLSGQHGNGMYRSYMFYDELGRLEGQLSADGRLTVYLYDELAPHSQPIMIARGVGASLDQYLSEPSDSENWDFGTDTIDLADVSSWAFNATDLAAIDESISPAPSVTRIRTDISGNTLMVVHPDGTMSATLRTLVNPLDYDFPNLDGFAVITLPRVSTIGVDGMISGPATVSFIDAGGNRLETAGFYLDGITKDSAGGGGRWHVLQTASVQPSLGIPNTVSPYLSSGTITDIIIGYEIDWERPTSLSRSVVFPFGTVVEHRTASDLSDPGDPEFFVTAMTYDAKGRMHSQTDPSGDVVQYTYDVLDRVIKVERGTTGNLVTILENFYDAGYNGGNPEQGVGTGNLTVSRAYPDGNPNNRRDTQFIHDFRGRMVKQLNPEPPHLYAEYDHLGRVTEQMVVKAMDATPPSVGNRLSRVQNLYSQRGILYRTRVAQDASESTPDWIISDRWVDGAAQLLAEQTSDSPRQIFERDHLNRVIRQSVAVHDDTLDYEEATTLDDAMVLEQSSMWYLGATSRVGYSGGYQLLHTEQDSITATGPLASNIVDLVPNDARDNVITAYTAVQYDALGRPVTSYDFGSGRHDPVGPGDTPEIALLGRWELLPVEAGTAEDNAVFPIIPLDGSGNPIPRVVGTTSDVYHESEYLRTETTYNERGLTETIIDPNDTVTRFIYDTVGRRIAVIENDDDTFTDLTDLEAPDGTTPYWRLAGATGLDADKNRITLMTYDDPGLGGTGQLRYLVAANYDPSTSSVTHQVTEYVFGVTTGDSPGPSALHSNALLREVRYPDKATGNPGTSTTDIVRYAYNRLGETIFTVDQRGVQRTFERDALGRVTADIADSIPSGVSTGVVRLGFEYDGAGRLTKATSYSDTSGTTIVNATQAVYNDGTGLLELIRQNPTGDIGSGDSKDFEIVYNDNVPGRMPRPIKLLYPTNSFEVDIDYGGAGGINDVISRPSGLSWMGYGAVFGSPDVPLQAQYAYLGIGTPVIKKLAIPLLDRHLRYDLYENPTDHDSAAETHWGIDRFGRQVRDRWLHGDDPVELMDWEYVYSDANRLVHSSRIGRIGGEDYKSYTIFDHIPDDDEKYLHDDLDRLIETIRGTAPAFTSTITGSEDWGYDQLGNWYETGRDTTGNGTMDAVQTRLHNHANELIEIDDGGSPDLDHTFDDAGNMRFRRTRVGSTVVRWQYTYDAWNRMVAISVDPGLSYFVPRSQFQYNALHERTLRVADADLDYTLNERTRYYYDASWRIIEEHTDVYEDEAWEHVAVLQRVWGLMYLDEMLFYHRDGRRVQDPEDTPDGLPDDGYYALHDRLGSVMLLCKTTDGEPAERINYSSYGVPTAIQAIPGDIDWDGEISFFTEHWTISQVMIDAVMGVDAEYDARADFNRNGVIDSSDAALTGSNQGHLFYIWPAGSISLIGNTIGYAGYVWEPSAGDPGDSGLWIARHRYYSPHLGRWITRDPAGYVDGANLYGYATESPITNTDPSGLDPRINPMISPAGTPQTKAKPKIDPYELTQDQLAKDLRKICRLFGAEDECDPCYIGKCNAEADMIAQSYVDTVRKMNNKIDSERGGMAYIHCSECEISVRQNIRELNLEIFTAQTAAHKMEGEVLPLGNHAFTVLNHKCGDAGAHVILDAWTSNGLVGWIYGNAHKLRPRFTVVPPGAHQDTDNPHFRKYRPYTIQNLEGVSARPLQDGVPSCPGRCRPRTMTIP